MNGHFIEAATMFGMSLLLALVALMFMRTDHGWAVAFAVLAAGFGISAFLVIFADIRRTAKLLENQSVERKWGLEGS